jgi:hypothetical protein
MKTQKSSKYYYAFEGQNASTGDPNPITGRMAFWGEILCFDTFADRKKYVEMYESCYAQDILVAGSKSSLRKYCLGMSVNSYEEYLRDITVDSLGWSDERQDFI